MIIAPVKCDNKWSLLRSLLFDAKGTYIGINQERAVWKRRLGFIINALPFIFPDKSAFRKKKWAKTDFYIGKGAMWISQDLLERMREKIVLKGNDICDGYNKKCGFTVKVLGKLLACVNLNDDKDWLLSNVNEEKINGYNGVSCLELSSDQLTVFLTKGEIDTWKN